MKELEIEDIAQVACGCYHTMALSGKGQVYSFGRNSHGQLGDGSTNQSSVPVLIHCLKEKRVTQIAAGFYHSVVLVHHVPTDDLADSLRLL